jgi:dTDP-4-dehydrorhamnose 3,5-epimerase
MKVSTTEIDGLLIFDPEVFGDERGFFLESWNEGVYTEKGLRATFVQDNLSRSSKGVLRGLHYQNPKGQGKLVQVLEGEVFDVAVDIRRGSPTFGEWYGLLLSADNHRQFYIPSGFAHGFCVMSDTALFHYKCTQFYNPGSEYSVLWDDPDLSIDWPIENPVVSGKDRGGRRLADFFPEELPIYKGKQKNGLPDEAQTEIIMQALDVGSKLEREDAERCDRAISGLVNHSHKISKRTVL